MFSIKKTLRKLIKWAIIDKDEPESASYANSSLGGSKVSSLPGGHHSSNLDSSRGIHFTVFNATGGKVIQVTTYDPRTDRSTNNLHVVTDNENLGEELAHIITVESLTR